MSNWSLDEKRNLTWNVTVPPNTAATAILPTVDEKTTTEGVQPIAKAKSIKTAGAEPGQMTLELGPGTYEFRSALNRL